MNNTAGTNVASKALLCLQENQIISPSHTVGEDCKVCIQVRKFYFIQCIAKGNGDITSHIFLPGNWVFSTELDRVIQLMLLQVIKSCHSRFHELLEDPAERPILISI